MAQKKQAQTINPFTGQPVTRDFRVKQIKSWINQMPWKHLGMPDPSLNDDDPNLDAATMAAASKLEEIGKSLGMLSLVTGILKLKQDDLDAAADILFDAKSELTKVMKNYETYHQMVGDKIWTLEEKIKAINESEYPSYFPQPWHPKNIGSFVGGKNHGSFGCRPGDNSRNCETPYYNHFLMWGPDAPREGTNGPDPRYLRVKRKYPHLFTQEEIRARVLGKKQPFFIPSPGVAPYKSPPAEGSIYRNVNNADALDKEVKSEGLKFMDEEDKQDYDFYLKSFNAFKEKEMQKAETVAYIEEYFKRFPYKKKKFEHSHGPGLLDPSKLGPSHATDEAALLSIASRFEKAAQDKKLTRQQIHQAFIKVLAPKEPPFYELVNVKVNNKTFPGAALGLKIKGLFPGDVREAPHLTTKMSRELGTTFIVTIKVPQDA